MQSNIHINKKGQAEMAKRLVADIADRCEKDAAGNLILPIEALELIVAQTVETTMDVMSQKYEVA